MYAITLNYVAKRSGIDSFISVDCEYRKSIEIYGGNYRNVKNITLLNNYESGGFQ